MIISKIGAECLVGDGAHASIERTSTGILYLSSKNFKQEGIDLSDVSFISETDYARFFKDSSKSVTTPMPNDILLGIIGSIGAPYLVRKNDKFGISSSVAILRPKQNLNSIYLFYYLKTDAVQKHTESIKSGSAQGFLSLEMIKSIPIKIPPLPVQARIASILSAYDDLIENNSRRIALLEQMAQAIYTEWFVRFRIQGKALELEAGTGLPKGWEVVKLGEVVEILGGGTPDTSEESYWTEGTINWFSPTDITSSKGIFLGDSKSKITELGLRNSSAKLFPAHCVMMTSRATIGEVGINIYPSTTNQGFIVCIPNHLYPYPFLYFWIKERKEVLNILSTGSTFGEMTKGNFKKFLLIKPPIKIMESFNSCVSPIFNQIKNLQQQNENLRRTRDALLPRLMSGELAV